MSCGHNTLTDDSNMSVHFAKPGGLDHRLPYDAILLHFLIGTCHLPERLRPEAIRAFGTADSEASC